MDPRKRLKSFILASVIVLMAVFVGVGMISGARIFAQTTGTEGSGTAGSRGAAAAETGQTSDQAAGQAAGMQSDVPRGKASMSSYAFLAAAVAFGLGAVGAGIAIGNVGAAAMGAVAEKPEIAGQALIFVALAEGLVVFGFITALMILGKV
jgi:V/A-type H+-transporting ATPase subunit K